MKGMEKLSSIIQTWSRCISDRNNNIYVCDYYNHRIEILTEELKYHSMLGIGLLKYPRDVKVTRDRVLVLDVSDPCMFVFNSDHVLTNRLITRGVGKQTRQSMLFRHRQRIQHHYE